MDRPVLQVGRRGQRHAAADLHRQRGVARADGHHPALSLVVAYDERVAPAHAFTGAVPAWVRLDDRPGAVAPPARAVGAVGVREADGLQRPAVGRQPAHSRVEHGHPAAVPQRVHGPHGLLVEAAGQPVAEGGALGLPADQVGGGRPAVGGLHPKVVELRSPGPLQVQHRVRAVLVAQQGEVVHAEAGRGVSHAQFLSAHSAQTRALTIDQSGISWESAQVNMNANACATARSGLRSRHSQITPP